MSKGLQSHHVSLMIWRLRKYRCLPFILLAILTCVASQPVRGQAAAQAMLAAKPAASPAQQTSPAPVVSPTPVPAIALPQIADQAEQLDQLLRDISKTLVPVQELQVSDPEGKLHAEEVRQRARQAEDLLAEMPNMMQLQDEERYWRALEEEYGSERKALTARAAAMEKQLQTLDAQQARWQATLEPIHKAKGLEVVAERVKGELDAIQKLRAEVQEQLNQILTFQNRLSEQDREISEVLQKLAEGRTRLHGSLLQRDSHPLWSARELRAGDQSFSNLIYASAGRGFTGVSGFLRSSKVQLFGIVTTYLFTLLAAFQFRRYVRGVHKLGVNPDACLLFGHPWSVALLVTLLTTVGIVNTAPTGVSFVVCLLYLLPVLRLLPALIEPQMRKVLYAICAFYVLQWAHLVLQLGAVFKREAFALAVLTAVITFAWLIRPSQLKIDAASTWQRKLFIYCLRLGLVLLAVSLFANILGFVSLGQIVGAGTLFSGFIFALIYTVVRVLESALATVVGSDWFQSLPGSRAQVADRWGRRILISSAILLWLNNSLHLFTVHEIVLDAIKSAFEYPLGFGKIHFTLGGILALVFVLVFGYVVANIAKFLLEEVILPRLSLRSGLTYAISRVTYYILLVGIFFAALTNAGVDLTKFTLITGALGLGIGFGLQNIVNNFASGLIILFERPFRIGDSVEVGGVTGTISRIGARSTTLLTFQHAEVIVPNSNLLSNQVVNWTLTAARRRVEIPVNVAYGTDPEVALKLLVEVANANKRILRDPKPEASFLGFGESALMLELRFWAAHAIWAELKSEIGLAVFRALREADIQIPFPQRDLHVRTIESASKEGPTAVSDKDVVRKVAAGR
jgi:potassium-dependent mechanosensitive channel